MREIGLGAMTSSTLRVPSYVIYNFVIFFLSHAILRKPQLVYTAAPSHPEDPSENEKASCFKSDSTNFIFQKFSGTLLLHKMRYVHA